MKRNAILIMFGICAWLSLPPWATAGEAYTPPKNCAERRGILAALRNSLGFSPQGMVFIVRHLKVKDGWAWIETDPRSPDGKNRYEPVDALLQEVAGKWQVKNIRPCCAECEEDPECADIRKYYRKLKRLFPNVPPDIFPD